MKGSQLQYTYWEQVALVICALVTFATEQCEFFIISAKFPEVLFIEVNLVELIFMYAKEALYLCYAIFLLVPLFTNSAGENYEKLLNVITIIVGILSFLIGCGFFMVYLLVSVKSVYLYVLGLGLMELTKIAAILIGRFLFKSSMQKRYSQYVTIKRSSN